MWTFWKVFLCPWCKFGVGLRIPLGSLCMTDLEERGIGCCNGAGIHGLMTGRGIPSLRPQKQIQQFLHKTKKELALMFLHGRYWGPSFDLTLPIIMQMSQPVDILVLHLILPSEATFTEGMEGEISKKRIAGLPLLLESKNKPLQKSPPSRDFHDPQHPPLAIYVSTPSAEFSLPPHSTWKQKCFSFWVDSTFQYAYFWRSRTTVRYFLLSLLKLFWLFPSQFYY